MSTRDFYIMKSLLVAIIVTLAHATTNPTKMKRKMGWPLQMFDAAPVLDGSLAGDAGFDPLRLARDRETLFFLREGEVKHARIAMLAAVGWPMSELYHYTLSRYFGSEYMLANEGKAPSVLNGGLDNFFVILSFGTFFAVGAVLEFELKRKRKEIPESLRNFYDMWREDGWDTPGNYGFDPLQLGHKLCGNDNDKKLLLQTIEIFNGRLSMLATVGYAVQEYTTNMPVVKETPQFFQPFLPALFGEPVVQVP